MYRLYKFQNYQHEKSIIGINHIIDISRKAFFLGCHWNDILLRLKLLFLIISMRYRIIDFKLFNLKNVFHWDLLLTIFYYVHWVYVLIVWHAYQVNVVFLDFLFCLEFKVTACLPRYVEHIAEGLTFLNKALPHWYLIRLCLRILLLSLLFIWMIFLNRRMLQNRMAMNWIKSTTKISMRINLLSIVIITIDNLANNPGRFDVDIG